MFQQLGICRGAPARRRSRWTAGTGRFPLDPKLLECSKSALRAPKPTFFGSGGRFNVDFLLQAASGGDSGFSSRLKSEIPRFNDFLFKIVNCLRFVI